MLFFFSSKKWKQNNNNIKKHKQIKHVDPENLRAAMADV